MKSDIHNITSIIKEEFLTTEVKNEIELYNLFIKEIEEKFTSLNFNTTKLDNGEDEFYTLENILITLTTT